MKSATSLNGYGMCTMATTKILAVHEHLNRAVNYVANPKKTAMEYELQYATNPEKTEQLLYCDAINCRSVKTAYEEMQKTKRRFSKEGGVLAFHFIQSFAPGEVTPDETHAIGMEFAEKCFGDKFQVVVATHLNCDHLHNHILVNSVGCFDGRKYHSNARSYYEQIRATSDQICREHGLSVIEEPKAKGKSYAERDAEKQGKPTLRGMIRADVDMVLAKSINWQTFVMGMKKIGYEVRYGPNVKYATVKHIKGSRAVRLKSLGEDYTEEAIRKRLAQRGYAPARRLQTEEQQPQPTATPAIWMPDWNVRPRRSYGRYRGHFPMKPKVKGFMALYYHYLHLLSKTKKRHSSKRTYFLLREDFQKFDRYLAQCDYIWQHHIEDSAGLETNKTALEQQVAQLSEQRRQLQNQKRRVKPEMELAEINEKIAAINAELKSCRAELTLCGFIEADVTHLQMQLAEAQQEERAERQRQEEQHKKEMKIHEQRR